MTPVCFAAQHSPSKMGVTLKGKNSLHKEQISSFKSRSPFRREANLKMTEVFALKAYPLTLEKDDFAVKQFVK